MYCTLTFKHNVSLILYSTWINKYIIYVYIYITYHSMVQRTWWKIVSKTHLNAGSTYELNSSGVASFVIQITGTSTAASTSVDLTSSCKTGQTCCHRSFCNVVNNWKHLAHRYRTLELVDIHNRTSRTYVHIAYGRFHNATISQNNSKLHKIKLSKLDMVYVR